MSSTDGANVRDDRQDRLQVIYDAHALRDVHARRRGPVVLATLPDKVGGLLPHVYWEHKVIRKTNHSFVTEIDKSRRMLHLEAEQREAKQNIAEQDSHFRDLGSLFSVPSKGVSDLLH